MNIKRLARAIRRALVGNEIHARDQKIAELVAELEKMRAAHPEAGCFEARNELRGVRADRDSFQRKYTRLAEEMKILRKHVIERLSPPAPDIISSVIVAGGKIERLEIANERLKMEARCHAMEARSQRSVVHECYQAATGATGEPGDWNGAKPVREAFEQLRNRVHSLTTLVSDILETQALDELDIYPLAVELRDKSAALLTREGKG